MIDSNFRIDFPMIDQIMCRLEDFRTWLALRIDPNYQVALNLWADARHKIRDLEAENGSLLISQDRHASQLFELGKYKANYRLMDAALRNRNSIFLRVTRSSGDVTRENWFPGHCTAEKLFASLTGEQLPHKELS